MSNFELDKFDNARLVNRTEVVSVPELKEFFTDPEKPDWTVRQLTGLEVAECRRAMAVNKAKEDWVAALMQDKPEDKVQALRELAGIHTETAPDDYVYRVACLHMGSVDPSIDETQAVRIADAFPTAFSKLTDKIVILTGMGKTLGE